ncbi:hypothetical protein Acid345_4122 [Candidatus Koribacter versatilis Ellin345]|uniref:Integrin-like protein n=1 Tax=Koribacter versatilis (strain Ellin345) TaxID=204669 RepID=Q1IJ28_KORVE|nr:FG-GAP-like repeat-containing protein [Candidatus Koribacter versatilis]ABF43122.1 hypothetical protein Acid345_4122 [Candidatus Koribacter versatilis Ellin345]
MRFAALALSLVLALPLVAQTGFSTHTYAAPVVQHLIPVDVNGDGFPDLVTYGGPVDVYLNDGHGGMLPRKYIGVFAAYAAVAQFAGDALPEIATCHINSGNTASTISIYINHGSGNFSLAGSAPLDGICTSLSVGDVDGDGKLDVVTTSYAHDASSNITGTAITTFFSNGLGSLNRSVTQANPDVSAQNDPTNIFDCHLSSATGGDYEQAGRLDLVLIGACQSGATNAGTIFYGTSDKAGHYSLKEIKEDERGFDYFPPYTADVNGDGTRDVVLIDYQSGPHNSWSNSLDFLENHLNGQWTLKQVFTESSYAASYLSAVFSGAGADFINGGSWEAVAGFTQSPDCCTQDTPGIAILTQDTSGNYVESQRWTAKAYPYATVAADFNKDGKPDIATVQVNSSANTASLVLYLNSGAPACPAPSSPGVHLCSPVAGNTYTSPVNVRATGKAASGSVVRLELWVDGKKYGNFSGSTMNANALLGSGSHRIVVVEDDSTGGHLNSTPAYITVN